MAVKFSNNASTTLASAINNTTTSITVTDASRFPTLGVGDYTYVTFDADTIPASREVVKVTAIVGNVLTVVRGQDGTSATAFDAGVAVELRLTAALLNDVAEFTDLSSSTTTDLAEGTNLYYTDERVDDRVNALIIPGLGITTAYDDTAGTLTIESDTIEELCKNGTGSTILKGTPVYQTGTAGNAMVIAPADASSASTMPAVGVLSQDLAAEAEGNLILMGRISGVDTSAFGEGDVIYVASGGGYTNVRPTGQSILVQNLGRVTKVHASNGGGVIMGAGRSNDVPNLTDGNIFIGNASGTYDKRAIVTADISDLTATATEVNYTDGVTSSIQTQLDSKLPSSSYTASDVLTKIKTVDGSGSGLDADLLDGQEGSYYTGYADTAVANLVASAPSTLDTLNELAAALGDDPNFATTVTNSIATKAPLASPTFTGTVTADGLNINGTATMDGLTVDGDVSIADAQTIYFSGTIGDHARINYTDSDPDTFTIDFYQNGQLEAGISFASDSEAAAGGKITLKTGGTSTALFADNGDISFYEDTGTTAKLTWDASAESLNFADNGKATFGAGNDLEIYHDGSDSYIVDNGTGDLKIQGANLRLENPSGVRYFQGSSGISYLYNSGDIKLNTTSTGIDVTGNIAVSGTVDGRDVATDGTKLDGIESGATADQTAAEILTAIKTVDGTGSGLDADLLDGQQGSYYYPASNPNGYTTNVGDITGVTAGVGLSGGGTSGDVTLTVDLSELTDMTAAMVGTDEFIVLDASADRRKAANEIGLSIFNNDAGFTTNVGDITGVTAGSYLTGGGTSGTVTLNVDATTAATASKIVARDGNGYIFGAFFNSAGTFSTTGATSGMGRFTGTNGTDTYGRSYTAQAAATLLSGSTMNIAGNATTATTLQTARTINGVSFNGSANITVADATKLPLTGGTLSGNVSFGDNNKALFGASSDLQIYHDGTHSRIVDQGTGALLFETNGSSIQLNKSTTENMAVFNTDGAVTLYYDSAAKIATISTGIDVTGTVRSDSLSNGSGTTKIYYDSSSYFSGTFSDKVTALGNTGTAKTIDCSTGNVFTATLTGNCTFTLSTPNSTANRATSFTLVLTNDATASRTVALSGGTFKYPGGTISRTTDANATDIWFFFSPDNGTTWYVTIPMKNLTT